MKRIIPCLLLILCSCFCLASIADDVETADGWLTTGEYPGLVSLEGNENLIVNGGDADVIDTWDSSRLEVYATSLPLSLIEHRGVYDIHLHDDSFLLFKGGATQSIKIGYNSTAELRGGQINNITIVRRPQDACYVTIYTQAGYQMNATGISGLWADGTAYNIHFDNMASPYPPTVNFVNVEIVPEPTTLALLGLGGLLVRKKK